MNRFILNETSYFGNGCRAVIAEEIVSRNYIKALLVSDKVLDGAGVVAKVTQVLDAAGLKYDKFLDIKQNPTVSNCLAGIAAYKASGADYIIAIGGGSVIDTAKTIGMVINNPEFADIKSLEGVAATKHKSVPIIALPTTAGTAAEVTINYVITLEDEQRKIVCVDPKDIPLCAIVDAELMASMPSKLIASTGMDALTHAIEGYITKGAWEMSDMFSIKSIEIIGRALRAAVKGDSKAIEDMALGQYVAGMSFSNVGLGIVHSMAHPLGSIFDIPHGVANAVLLPTVMKFNKSASVDKYIEIARVLGEDINTSESKDVLADKAIAAVEKLSKDIGIPQRLSDIGITAGDIGRLSEQAIKDVCTGGNPKDVTIEDIVRLYKEIL